MKKFSRDLKERLDTYSIPEPNSGCILWLGPLDRKDKGYGLIVVRPEPRVRICKQAHRLAYELTFGEVPKGLVVDHQCNTPECINPYHLKVMTQKENLRKSNSIQGKNFRKTECLRGHPFDKENTYWIPSGTGRACKQCSKDRRSQLKTSEASNT